MLNLGSAFNLAILNQINYQVGQNVATNSPGANQTLIQNASNSAVIAQRG